MAVPPATSIGGRHALLNRSHFNRSIEPGAPRSPSKIRDVPNGQAAIQKAATAAFKKKSCY
jgi:hypothetical protein